jgi:flagellin
MVSINYVASNAAVVRSMKAVAAQLSETQERIATGYRINAASDNGSVWATAQTIRSDLAAQDVVKGDIGVAKAKADVAAAALDTIGGLLDQIKEKTVAAQASGASFTALAADVAALKSQIAAVIGGATVNNVNWLSGTGAAQSVNVDISGGTAVPLSVTTIKIDNTGTALTTMVNNTTLATAANFTTLGGQVDTAKAALVTYSATLRGFSGSLDTQSSFLTTVADIRRQALSSLVDADMEEESAKLQALQVKQQLAYQALAGGPMTRSPSRT